MSVTFDRALVIGDVDPTNWSARINNRHYAADAATIHPGDPTLARVTLRFLSSPETGPNACWYQASPADVLGNPDLTPATAFADFPVT